MFPRPNCTQLKGCIQSRRAGKRKVLCQNEDVTIGTPTPAGLSTTSRAARGGGSWVIVFIAGLGSLALSLVSGSHVIFAVITLPLVASMAWSSPTTLISILPVWMVLLGFVRRFTPGGGNVTFSGDPVLLIGPVALIVLLLVTLSARGAPPMSRLARVVLGFNIVALIEVANPSQGGLMAGLGGLLFVFVPTVAFWIGRRFGTEELLWRVAWNVAILSLIVALYGLYQQFVRFPTWDLTWIASKGYTALNLGSGVIRAFSTFSSAQEYAAFLSVGVVTWAILASRASRLPFPVHMAGLATVAAALFYESQRTSMFITALALGIVAAARLRMRPLTVAMFGVASVVLLVAFAGSIGGNSGSAALQGPDSTAAILVNHQLSGITDPTGSGSSLPGHIKATRVGMFSAIKTPFGHGSGSTNLAASRYSTNSHTKGTEFDPGNMGIAFGIFGLVLYVLMLWNMTSMGYRLAVRRRDPLGLLVLGVIMATLLQWTNGNLYSVCWLLWFVVGVGDGMESREEVITPTVETKRVDPAYTWRRPGEPRRAVRVS